MLVFTLLLRFYLTLSKYYLFVASKMMTNSMLDVFKSAYTLKMHVQTKKPI